MAVTEGKIKEWLRGQLAGFPEVQTFAPGKVFPVFIPQVKQLPAITYRRQRTQRGQTMKGSIGQASPVFRVNCWSVDHDQADGVVEALLAFQNWRPPAGFWVRRVEVVDQGDEYVRLDDGSDTVIFGPYLDLLIVHCETLPALGASGP